MNNVERHQLIIKKIEKNGHVSVVDLCAELQVSSVTIRKDLQFLEDEGMLHRTHGGATSVNPYQKDRPINEKALLHADAKERIGWEAAKLVEPNDSIIIASGTTMQFFARQIVPQEHLTVITSAINVTMELIKHDTVDIIQLGGPVRKTSSSIMGSYAEALLGDFFCSKLFLGVDGIDADFGITTTNAQEALLNRKMMESVHKVIVLADFSKFDRKSLGKIADLVKIDMIISDNIPLKYQQLCDNLGIEYKVC
ncbi:DeoR/GlpR family DNA-binding transcription regulator [Sphingobacterium oryzagri]|uniref:DeoR/GlpR family DNA-binding transcription regulator n=1 Tax=Sphingobacterium oryzagri TaxID=3025669 RepID=A0ABY7WL17_9SPHI|nr:DeoR/GlpR family DNA-binding transcription regulator [Sphingobacterium sp. KACC 22765]WDF70291.1 DeoR/GlpR family DNA-binding transcription regulator [Sphingobacterium sp. KACC 22765]